MAPPIVQGVAFITGAGSGIGQAAALSLATYGASALALADISPSNLETTINLIKTSHPNVKLLGLDINVADEASVNTAISTTVQTFGRIDIAVNNAGIIGPVAFSRDMKRSEWDHLLSINLTGVMLCQGAEVRVMLEQEPLGDLKGEGRGVIVNTASMLGLVGAGPLAAASAYAASKHAVVGFTRTEAVGLADKGIRVNAVCPGYIETPLLGEMTGTDVMNKELEKVPMGRMGKAEEIGDCIAFLAGRMSSYMTGATLVPDGGFTAQ